MITTIIFWGCVAVNVISTALNILQFRRWTRINRMLIRICLMSWRSRPWPLPRRMMDAERKGSTPMTEVRN